MKFSCRPVDLGFIDTAPIQIVNVIELSASPEQVFAILADENSWPKWFNDIKKVTWTSPKPHGVGSTRTVNLKAMTAKEQFIAWDAGKRYAFYFTQTSIPFVHALCEDYLLAPAGEGKTTLTYTVACEPRGLLKLLGPLSKKILGRMFKGASISLARYIEQSK